MFAILMWIVRSVFSTLFVTPLTTRLFKWIYNLFHKIANHPIGKNIDFILKMCACHAVFTYMPSLWWLTYSVYGLGLLYIVSSVFLFIAERAIGGFNTNHDMVEMANIHANKNGLPSIPDPLSYATNSKSRPVANNSRIIIEETTDDGIVNDQTCYTNGYSEKSTNSLTKNRIHITDRFDPDDHLDDYVDARNSINTMSNGTSNRTNPNAYQRSKSPHNVRRFR